MATSTNPQPYQKQNPHDRWLDVIYVAMLVVSIVGLTYVVLEAR
jgi:hypothetical protein